MISDKSRTLEQLVDEVNAWCDTHNISPANGQSSDQLSLRTLRYYRTLGLLTPPLSGAEYGEIHRLQVTAIRVLQAQGLPLRRIQNLLYGRSEADLRQVLKRGLSAATDRTLGPQLPVPEDWRVVPVDDSVWLVLRHGRNLSPDQISRIQAVIQPSPQRERSTQIESKS